jgi:hypothetical protein
VEVPEGKDVGGSFQKVPLCRSPGQIGCVVSYASYKSTTPVPKDALFGKAGKGFVAACNNPASLTGGKAVLTPYFPMEIPAELDGFINGQTGPFTDPEKEKDITTDYFTVPGFLEGECVTKNGLSYLEVTVLADPDDPRADDIGGELSPAWGLHLVDVNLAMGDIVGLVESQVQQYLVGN